MDSQTQTDAIAAPIFILGIRQRSGTNFLCDLLSLHPDCEGGSVIREDFFTARSDLLIKFVEPTYKLWTKWGVEDVAGSVEQFYHYLGDSLLSYLKLQADQTKIAASRSADSSSTEEVDAQLEMPVSQGKKRLVAKTPSVKNLKNFFRLFPNAYLLILVRDGRSVVESGMKTFERGYEEEMRAWGEGAQEILEAEAMFRSAQQKFRVIRYEDLYTNTEKELRSIFNFLDLDVEAFDFDAALNLPVKGSSTAQGKDGKVHWKPVAKTADFNPLKRWSYWGRDLHERYNWITGNVATRLGYPLQEYTGNKLYWFLWNIAADVKSLGWKKAIKIARQKMKSTAQPNPERVSPSGIYSPVKE